MFTPKCTHAGCHWTGISKKTKTLAEQAVRMHIGRIHSQTIRTPKLQPAAPAVATAPVALASGDRLKRPYTRRNPIAATASNGVEVKVNFCSNCGAPIEGLAEAVVLAGLLRNRPKFRAKIEKLLEKHT